MFLNGNDLLDEQKRNSVQQFIDTMPIAIGVKDLASQYVMGNNYFANLVGLIDGHALRGIYDQEVKCGVKQSAHLFVAEDKLTMRRNQSVSVLTYSYYAQDKPILLYGRKYPLMDQNGAITGCGFCSQDITNSPIANLTPFLSLRKTAYGHRHLGDQFSYIIADTITEYHLSTRQMECLFYILRGRSANDIATLLTISKRTVETHIDEIKCKLGCSNKAELIDTALGEGLLNYIPSSFLQEI